MRTEVSIQITYIPYSVKILLFLTCEFLCRVQSTEILQRHLQEQRVWIRDIFIEFRIMERFFSAWLC